MKVTGWTYYENPNYIDIDGEGFELRSKALKEIPKLPDLKEIDNYTEEEIDEIIKKRDKMIREVLDREDVKERDILEKEVYNAVLEDIKINGYHFSGETHQYSEFGVPIVDNKYKLCLSCRSWGGLIAKAFPDEIDTYITWSWNSIELEKKSKIPDKSLWIE